MRKIRELLRLKFDLGLSDRKIAASLLIARSTVKECLSRTAAAGIRWPLPDTLDDAQLEARLYPVKPAAPGIELPDFAHLQRELSRPGVTRLLLWQEYKAQHPQGVQYSAFCDHYRQFSAAAEPVMRFEHRAGEKCFVDYAGQTVEVIDRYTGEIGQAQIFVAVLGCSNYTYAEAAWTQALPEWLGAHVRALEFFGGTPQAIVPDNLKSGVDRAHRYEPDLNRAYAEFAEHYAVAILPARVRKPRDKAKVEGAVLIVERWILARLRDRQFFSLTELNAAISELLVELNDRPFQKLDGSRRSRFIELDKPALKALPARRTSMRSGSARRSIPTITSNSITRTTPCRTSTSAIAWTYASARAWSRSSHAASSSPHTGAASSAAHGSRWTRIVPPTIAPSSIPRSNICWNAPRKSLRLSRQCCASSSIVSATLRKRCAQPKASCAWRRTSAPHTLPPRVLARCSSRPTATAVCVP